MIGYLWTRVRKQPIIAFYFEFEKEGTYVRFQMGPGYFTGYWLPVFSNWPYVYREPAIFVDIVM